MHVSIHENNTGDLVLVNTKPLQNTPQSKHYAIKTNWFREQIITLGIEVVKIDTKDQLGDVFTKSLPQVTFEHL